MKKTKIDWADYTWNPVWGCTFGCPYCYARNTARRWGKMIAGRDDFVPTFIEKNFNRELPRERARIFVNSMSDVADWEPAWMTAVAAKMIDHPQHDFMFLTKRPEVYSRFSFPENAWLGCSATEGYAPAAPRNGRVRFLSVEPLLGPMLWIDPLYSWVIIGAESGNRKEKVVPKREWVEDILALCRHHGVAVFFKESITKLWPEFDAHEYP